MKKTATSFLFAAAALVASAEVLTPAQALQRAGGQMRVVSLAGGSEVAVPAMTVNAADHMPALYVFGTPYAGNGFAILSADDLAVPVLGYADSGSFSAAEMPDNMKAWLDFYADEIAAARRAETASSNNGGMRLARPDREPIAPICTTKWNQDSPYNDMCPKEGASRCYTGCVATAMAQVLKTYEHPAKCNGGEVTYSYYMNMDNKKPSNQRELTLNFDEVELDWAEMLDSYSGSVTASQRRAVANLMYAVGVASEMAYGTSASGANAAYTAQGLIRNFDYNRDMTYEMREWYDLVTWEDMIYSTLKGGHAVYYDGQNSNSSTDNLSRVGAHAFVVDGYTGDGFFHLNWGWGGTSDGYFLLSALDPYSQGIGGSSSGYNFRQGTIVNMAPKSSNKIVAPLVFAIVHESKFGVTPTSVVATSSARVTFSGGYYNLSPSASTSNARLAVRYTAADGTQTYADGVQLLPSLVLFLGPEDFVCKVPTGLADGRYIVEPMVKSASGRYYEVRCDAGGYGQLIAEVSGSTIQFSRPQYAAVSVVEADVPSAIYSGTTFMVNGLLGNATDQLYVGGLRGCFVSAVGSEAKIGETLAVSVEVAPASESEFSLNVSVPSNLSVGNYRFCLTDYRGKVISDLYDITLQKNPGLASFAPSTMEVTSAAANELCFVVDASVLSGYYSGEITVVVRNGNDSSQSRHFVSRTVNIGAGETKSVRIEGEYTDAKVGETYTAQAFVTVNGQKRSLTDAVSFRMADPVMSSIESVDATETIAPAEYFDLQGRRVDNPRPGSIYLMRHGALSTKVRL